MHDFFYWYRTRVQETPIPFTQPPFPSIHPQQPLYIISHFPVRPKKQRSATAGIPTPLTPNRFPTPQTFPIRILNFLFFPSQRSLYHTRRPENNRHTRKAKNETKIRASVVLVYSKESTRSTQILHKMAT